MTKTEEKLLKKVREKKSRRTAVYGSREVQAAKKLQEKGLVEFINQSATVMNCARTQTGDYKSVFVYQGYIENKL